jgi:hypothetical protein
LTSFLQKPDSMPLRSNCWSGPTPARFPLNPFEPIFVIAQTSTPLTNACAPLGDETIPFWRFRRTETSPRAFWGSGSASPSTATRRSRLPFLSEEAFAIDSEFSLLSTLIDLEAEYVPPVRHIQ